jgi:glycosyltransferase involved in cell wall biosynthesis
MPRRLFRAPSASDIHDAAAPIRAVGIVVPAHNEERLLATALGSVLAASHRLDRRISVVISVVLDGCSDRSPGIARDFAAAVAAAPGHRRVALVETGPGNVGKARAAGCAQLLDALDRFDRRHLWLATTDADTTVPPTWLAHQLRCHRAGVDAWAGTIAVADWSSRSPRLVGAFATDYEHGHHAGRHVHGASLGFTADAYIAAGGFPPLATGEDVGLWRALSESGATLLYDGQCPVVTSARRSARAPAGFAYALDRLERGVAEGMAG